MASPRRLATLTSKYEAAQRSHAEIKELHAKEITGLLQEHADESARPAINAALRRLQFL